MKLGFVYRLLELKNIIKDTEAVNEALHQRKAFLTQEPKTKAH